MRQLFQVPHWVLVWSISSLLHVRGVPWDGAQPTGVHNVDDSQGWSPLPTDAPSVARNGLLARQNSPQICGFINADISSAIQCSAGYQCAINPFNSAAGCCADPNDCAYHTECVPYMSMGACGPACQSNAFITRCTNAAYPYCFVKYFEVSGYYNAFTEYDCADVPGVVTLYQTYTNVAQEGSVTPQLYVLTTTKPILAAAASQSPASGGVVVNCGQGGSCNVEGNGNTGSGNGNSGSQNGNSGSGNNGNNAGGSSAASSRFSVAHGVLLILAFSFRILIEFVDFSF